MSESKDILIKVLRIIIITGVCGIGFLLGVMIFNGNNNNNPVQTTAPASNYQASTPEQYKSSCRLITYDDLARYTSAHVGNTVKFSGRITQVTNQGQTILMSMELPGEYNTDTVWLDYSGSSTFLEDDQINVYGTVIGTNTYTTVMGASRSVPEVNAKYIELANGNPVIVTPRPQTLSFSGSGSQTINKFHLDAGLAVFSAHQSDSSHYLIATLKDNQGNYVAIAANMYNQADGSSSAHISKSGDYIIDVSSQGAWSMTVTQ